MIERSCVDDIFNSNLMSTKFNDVYDYYDCSCTMQRMRERAPLKFGT